MGPNAKRNYGAFLELSASADRMAEQLRRTAVLADALGRDWSSNRCDACEEIMDERHETFEYKDWQTGHMLRRCRTLPNPDAVTEEELAEVRRSILGEENA